jgi:hypothetical protein
MLYYDVLDDIADGSGIPNEMHPILHVNPRSMWVDIMADMIERGIIDQLQDNLYEYGKFWESMLYQRLSTLN